MSDHSFFIPWVEGFAHVHHVLGGGRFGIAIIQFGLWFLLYFAAVWLLPRVSHWASGIATYLATGLSTLAICFYAITPAMNLLGVAYLTLIWPLWTYAGVGVPEWLAPHLFSFGPRP
jgi:hypothetical protein